MQLEEIDFSNVDVDGLTVYDEAIKLEADSNISTEKKILKWDLVSFRFNSVNKEARARADAWRLFLKKKKAKAKKEYKQLQSKKLKVEQRINQLQKFMEEDQEVEFKRRTQMKKDWAKLSRLIKLDVVSDQRKLSWTEAFVEAYGAIEELNPYLDVLEVWTDKIGNNFEVLEEESEHELQVRKQRRSDIKLKLNKAYAIHRELIKRIKSHPNYIGVSTSSLSSVKSQSNKRNHNKPLSFLNSRPKRQIRPRTQTRSKKEKLEWKSITGGSFLMGSNIGNTDEKPVHLVNVKSFLITATEITVSQYRDCVENNVCSQPAQQKHCTWYKSNNDNLPVNCVDWGQARTYAKWVEGDLPTEAQWEYAARGGTKQEYSGSNDSDHVAWYSYNTRDLGPQIVGQLKANRYGLYDMSGNLWEWTLDEWYKDCFNASSSAEKIHGRLSACQKTCKAGRSARVSRGGSWFNYTRFTRVTTRSRDLKMSSNAYTGFRVAKQKYYRGY